MIKVLDSFIADKIAAGEVIERPVSIVKELIENSIDAGATSIIIEIRNGGKSYIRVTDNGSGIPADETETAFLRHATSKISGIEDLDRIDTLGFRGEALASIAAVSRLTIVTRTSLEATGTKLVMHGGQIVKKESVGANEGTTIIVEDVFYNTPARRKFMGTDAREGSAITELTEQYAVCYSGIRFMLVNNGVTSFTTDGSGETLDAVANVFSKGDFNSLIPVKGKFVHGYISDPGTTKSTRRGQIFFVNGRLVNSRVIEKGIERGYGDRIFSGYPVAVLFIETNPSLLDVNIHPGKKEIKFLNADEIASDIAGAVSDVLSSENAVPKAMPEKEVKEAPGESIYVPFSKETPVSEVSEQTDIKEFLANYKRPAEASAEESSSKASDFRNTAADYDAKHVVRPFEFSELQYKGYVFDAFIIMQAKDTLYILDQHAAHERIFYERLMNNFRAQEQLPQPVLTPFTLWVGADVYCMERDWVDTLRRMGYDISDFGLNTFIVRGIPPYMTLGEAEGFANGFAEALGEESDYNSVIADKLIMKSCKSAVKAGDKLSAGEIQELINELSMCENPYSCPHGRPTFIKVTRYEIEKGFKRK